jgi:hypothetical protein
VSEVQSKDLETGRKRKKQEILSKLVQKYYGSKPDSFANAMLENTLVVAIEKIKLTGKQRLE